MTFDDGAWFHVTNRGVAKQEIFRREPDYFAFLDCLGRHLGPEPSSDLRGRPYLWLRESVTVSSYGLMGNHFHLLARDDSEDGGALRSLMQRSQLAYASYFNRKYDRDGPLFKGRFYADPIADRQRLQEVATYIHLNFDDNPLYRHSSHRFWMNGDAPQWLQPAPAIAAVGGLPAYEQAMVVKLKRRSRKRVAEALARLAASEEKLARAVAGRYSERLTDQLARQSQLARDEVERADAAQALIASAKTLDEILELRGLK